MEEIFLFILSIVFGAFLFILLMMCCLRGLAYLRDEDNREFFFKRKESDLRRRRIQLALLPERPENLGYTAGPDENIDQYTICQNYVYEDGRSTGMGMIANLPISIAYTNESGNFSIFSSQQSTSGSQALHQNPEVVTTSSGHEYHQNYEHFQHFQNQNINQDYNNSYDYPPPPDYLEAQMQQLRQHNLTYQNINEKSSGEEEEFIEPPPPSYDECMQKQRFIFKKF